MSTSSSCSSTESTRRKRPRLLEDYSVADYTIIQTISDGPCARVMLAKHMSTEEEVAIKKIDKTAVGTGGVRRLFREAKIMKMLDHPNILKLQRVIDSPKHLYLVMEYVSGGDLNSFLQDNLRLKENQVRHIFRQVLSAIEYCHRKGVVHRDIKDENILIDGDMNIKIIDFGLSNMFAPGQKLETYCGTVECMAPEVILGRKYGPEIDVWSLGILLYILLTGSPPFTGPTPKVVKQQVLRCQYNIPHFIGIDCAVLLTKMLLFRPEKRQSLTSIMKDRWVNHQCEELRPYVEPESDLSDG